MVDCQLIDIEQITPEQRREIILYLINNKNTKPRDLGVDSSYIGKVRRGEVRVGDGLLCQALKFLDDQELALLLRGIVPERRASFGDVVRVVATARVDPTLREFLLGLIKEYLGDYLTAIQGMYRVGEGDIEEFIRAKRLKGLSEKTIRDEVKYIRRALAELDWTLTPEGIREYLASLREDGEDYVLKHTTYSLKSLLKEVLKPRNPSLFSMLYNSFTVFKPKNHNRTKLPTLEELRQVLSKIESIEAKTYFIILAETGLRPGESFLITMDDVDLEHGMLRIGKITETKRAFVAFLRPETLDFIKSQYLPRRDKFVSGITKPIEASGLFGDEVIERLKSRFLPFDQGRLRREIKEATRQVLNRDFELYELRKFFATWMISRGVPESIVNTLQGRAPPSEFRVLIEHYWSPRHEELRQWYLRHAPCLLCRET
ncbi:tyrosine-type recombinase/integrase [Vulcanisaeta souniana]|uniref:Integrase n=1 Tax=Vulcanisaeta souniana JCM 11219 TaxID=1293586 RepID=A0A830EB36_9CREN|nr:site-specific integrase [Vulcanisaeta souniana]BDR92215.1 integrase [Vulcanisaeta souniana JCM 11219]GGI67069.1 integrase [Vulcanisaeta souniana JCM 11219]